MNNEDKDPCEIRKTILCKDSRDQEPFWVKIDTICDYHYSSGLSKIMGEVEQNTVMDSYLSEQNIRNLNTSHSLCSSANKRRND